jgi:protein arginine N-methyltransferase 5
VLSTDAFVTNKRGFPVLPKRHQELVATLLKYNVQVILRGERRHNPELPDASTPASAVTRAPTSASAAPPPAPSAASPMLADAAGDGADADGGGSDVASAGGAAGALAAAAPAKAAHELTLYWEYLAFIFGRLEEVSEQERVESGYRDYLQARGCADAGLMCVGMRC